MAKIIGIPGWMNDTQFGAGKNHLEFISTFGNPRILMPWEDKAEIDLLYLPGGLDLAPSAYGATPSYATSNTNVMLQNFYDKKLKLYVEAKTPIFGVCLGFQMLCAYFGCELTQNLKWHPNSQDRWMMAHEVEILATRKKLKVNGHHHQGVTLQQFNEQELRVLAIAKDTGDGVLVEAMKHKTLPIIATQWHPEEWYDDYTEDLIKSLLNFHE